MCVFFYLDLCENDRAIKKKLHISIYLRGNIATKFISSLFGKDNICRQQNL